MHWHGTSIKSGGGKLVFFGTNFPLGDLMQSPSKGLNAVMQVFFSFLCE